MTEEQLRILRAPLLIRTVGSSKSWGGACIDHNRWPLPDTGRRLGVGPVTSYEGGQAFLDDILDREGEP